MSIEKDANWNSLVDRLVSSLEASRKARIISSREDNVLANKQLRERILSNRERAKKSKQKSEIKIFKPNF